MYKTVTAMAMDGFHALLAVHTTEAAPTAAPFTPMRGHFVRTNQRGVKPTIPTAVVQSIGTR
jgi:hypothetical protein